jgi:AcrR family transcriptional regulator
MSAPASRGERTRLSRERVLSAALSVADEGGVGSLTIRSLAAELGTKPMSVYHHVANKDEILDGIVDLVFAEVDLPVPDRDWRAEVRRRCESMRAVLARHRWAIGLLESRARPGPATLRQHEQMLATLRAAGFSVPMTAHAYAVLDSYVYGFALQEATLPFEGGEVGEVARSITDLMPPGEYPHLVEMTTELYLRPGQDPGYDFGEEFDFGLDLVLDGLAAHLGG